MRVDVERGGSSSGLDVESRLRHATILASTKVTRDAEVTVGYNPASALLAVTKDLKGLAAYILQGTVVEILTDDELRAAQTAFSKVPHARNPDQQVWSAINHLEAAHERLRRCYYGKRAALIPGGWYLDRLATKDQFVLCLMASCYKVVSEPILCKRALDEAAAIDEMRFLTVGSPPGSGIAFFLDPRTYREVYAKLTEPKYTTDVSAFRQNLL